MDIDTSGFELGMPTHTELLEQQCHLLCHENDQLRRELARSRRNIQKLVEINQALQGQFAAEARRANGHYVRLVHIFNRLRCSHSIDASNWFTD